MEFLSVSQYPGSLVRLTDSKWNEMTKFLELQSCDDAIKVPPLSAAAKSLQLCLTLCDSIDGSPPRLPRPWDFPGKNTGVGCHFLLRCMKVKSESEVAQLCPTLSNPMDCSLPGSSIHGIFQARVLEWGAIAFSDHSLRTRLRHL